MTAITASQPDQPAHRAEAFALPATTMARSARQLKAESMRPKIGWYAEILRSAGRYLRTTVTIMPCLGRYAPTIWSVTDSSSPVQIGWSLGGGRGGQPFLGVKGLPGLWR
jgi:hypothetical protein